MTGARCVARAGGRPDYKDRQNCKANIGTSTSGELERAWGSDVSALQLAEKLVLYADNVPQRLKPADLVEFRGAA
jgi:hypothetical protein